jgi:hypothetical protein
MKITAPIATPCKTVKNLVILPLWVAFSCGSQKF